VQEEIRLGQSGSSSSPIIMDEEGLALASKGKGKEEKKGGKKKNIDFSKVKCFQCHKLGNFASQCPEKKKGNMPQMATSAIDYFAKSFEEDFCLIACMSSLAVASTWFIDNGASCHMTRHKEFFTKLQEGGVNLHFELVDDRCNKVQGIAIVLL
jgi:hypothetical protein